MSWHTRRHLRRIDTHTERTATASEGILDGQRRAQLEAAGLIDFNAPADVVRGLERQLAIQRAEPVRAMFDLDRCRRMAPWGGIVAMLGLLIAAPLQFSGAVGAIAGLALLAGGCVSAFGLAELKASGQLHDEQAALKAYQAARERQIGA